MFFAIFVIGIIVTTALSTWFIFDYYGGLRKLLSAFRVNVNLPSFPGFGFVTLITGFFFVLSLLAWPLILILLVLTLAKRFNETGAFKIEFPKEVPTEN